MRGDEVKNSVEEFLFSVLNVVLGPIVFRIPRQVSHFCNQRGLVLLLLFAEVSITRLNIQLLFDGNFVTEAIKGSLRGFLGPTEVIGGLPLPGEDVFDLEICRKKSVLARIQVCVEQDQSAGDLPIGGLRQVGPELLRQSKAYCQRVALHEVDTQLVYWISDRIDRRV
jgi:hypothetical protein